jgi:glucoamylase
VNEIYHPRVDHAAIRDLEFIVTGSEGFFSEEKRDCASDTQTVTPGIPAYRVENHCTNGRYRISKEIFADPARDVLLQRIRFAPLIGSLPDYRLFVLLSPRLGDQGEDNSGWIGAFRDRQMLFAQRDGHALALASSATWSRRSVGFVGESDAWQDIRRHGQMTWQYDRADHGHIALAGEIDIQSCGGQFVLALALDRSPEAAALNASLAINGSFDAARNVYVQEWQAWQKTVTSLDGSKSSKLATANADQRQRPDSSRPRATEADGAKTANLYRTSMMVLRVHRSKQFAGASVASLAVPWGEVRGDADSGGYHLVWPRDLVEESFGFLAGGALEEALDVLNFLRVTQKPNGGWPQDMWLDGAANSDGVQLDETALPILLVDLAARESALKPTEIKSFWPMIRAAAAFLVRSGPSTGQDRWENTAGLSPYTLATEIAALLVAARLAEQFGEPEVGKYFRQTADLWNDSIESWTYVTDTPLARRIGVQGYYIRIAPSPGMKSISQRGEHPTMHQARDLPVTEVVSPDALALVRFGLRAADDPRIVNTVKVIDAVNRAETPAGPCWRRYNGGYYGETDEGEPFTSHAKDGHGRAWPLLTGERGHFELAAGNIDDARCMLITMDGLASQTGLLPEQVWDTDDLPKHDLYRGRPSGSAMPLAWTHSEYVRLLRSIRDGRVFDRPTDAWERYVKGKPHTDLALWRFDHQSNSVPTGRRLRIELLAPAVVHYSTDGWVTAHDVETHDTGIGLHQVDLPTAKMEATARLSFTFRWPNADNRWERKNFELTVDAPCGVDESRRGAPSKPRNVRQHATVEHRK